MTVSGYLQKECKGILRSKWQKRFFEIDYSKKALVQFNDDKRKNAKEKLKLADLHAVDRVKNIISIVGTNQTVLVLRAETTEHAECWFEALDKDFAEARRNREAALQEDAVAKAKSKAEAAASKRMGEINDAHSKSQADQEAAHAAILAEQQRKLEEEKKAREATEATLAEEQKKKLEEEKAAVEKAKREAEERECEQQEAEQKAAEATHAKAEAEAEATAALQAAEKARLEEETYNAKLQRGARFSGPNSIYHEAKTTWVDYPIISNNEQVLIRKSQSAKAAVNGWLVQQRRARAGTSRP